MKIWYLESESCYECNGTEDQLLTEDPEAGRALELEVGKGVYDRLKALKEWEKELWEELRESIRAADAAQREKQRLHWEAIRADKGYASGLNGMLTAAYSSLLDFTMKARPLNRDSK